MKYLVLLMLLLPTIASPSANNCEACSAKENETFSKLYAQRNHYQYLKELRDLIAAGNTADPEVFKKVRALLCGFDLYMKEAEEFCFQPLPVRMVKGAEWWQEEVRGRCSNWLLNQATVTTPMAHGLLELAIQVDAKDVVSLLFANLPAPQGDWIIKAHYGKLTKKYEGLHSDVLIHYEDLPIDLEILAKVEDHQDLEGMAELLCSFRESSGLLRKHIAKACSNNEGNTCSLYRDILRKREENGRAEFDEAVKSSK